MIYNHIKIEYGKYINNLPNEFDSTHIVMADSATINRRVEAGDVNFPTSETFTFALANLAPDGSERYPLSFWEGIARTAGEGATQPLQIYFLISVDADHATDATQFRGMLKSLKYSKDSAKAIVEVGDILEIARETDESLLASFEFETNLIAAHDPGEGRNDLEIAHDLDGNDLPHRALSFLIENKYSTDEYADLDSEFAAHLGLETPDFTNPYTSTPRSAWVQIEDITLLTRVQFIKKKGIYSSPSVYNRFHRLEMVVWHSYEDSVTVEGTGSADDVVFVPRGQYLDRDGNTLDHAPGGANVPVTMVVHEPDLGNGTDALLELADTPLNNDFIFGVPYTDQGTHIEITSATYSYFDVLDETTAILERLIADVHEDSGVPSLDFVDTTKVTKYRKAFWADIHMFGWLENNLTEALVGCARQVAGYMYTDRFGNVVIQSRSHETDILNAGAPEATLVQNSEWESLDGIKYDNGFRTYTAEIPQDVLEINNVATENKITIISDENGAASKPALRNKKVELQNFRIFDLGVPHQTDAIGFAPLRYSPDDASWPNPETLEDFLPTARTQLNLIAAALPWPIAITRIKLGRTFINDEYDDGMGTVTPQDFRYLVDENDQLWLVREEMVDIRALTIELEIKLVGTLYAET